MPTTVAIDDDVPIPVELTQKPGVQQVALTPAELAKKSEEALASAMNTIMAWPAAWLRPSRYWMIVRCIHCQFKAGRYADLPLRIGFDVTVANPMTTSRSSVSPAINAYRASTERDM